MKNDHDSSEVQWLDLAARIRLVIEVNTPDRGRYRELEEASGISSETWKAFWYGRQRATQDLLDHVFAQWPEMAFWVATGLTDVRHGHISPNFALKLEPYPIQPMPCTADYFKAATRVLRSRQAGIDLPVSELDQLAQLEAARTLELGYTNHKEDKESLQELEEIVIGQKVVIDDNDLPLVSRILLQLQTDLGWSDSEMADALDVTEPLYKQVKAGAVELLTTSQKLRIVDRWGYGRVRNALLSVLPENLAARLRESDNKRVRPRL